MPHPSYLRQAWTAVSAIICACFLLVSPAFANFGINSLTAGAINRDGSVDLQAGSHPYEYKLSFTMNQDGEGNPQGTLRDLVVDLPRGMVGNQLAVPRCSGSDFEGAQPRCPGDTQIGVATIKMAGFGSVVSPVYNLMPPRGVLASIGFSLLSENSFQEAALRSSDYGVSVADITVPTDQAVQSVTETIWGVPADAGHDSGRTCRFPEGGVVEGCFSESAPAPFLTLPTSCAGSTRTTVSVDSVQEPGVFRSRSVESLGESGTPEALSGCERLPFAPTLTARSETTVAGSPTGIHLNLHIPQNEAPEQLAAANLRDTVVTLPQGMVINPSAADGLGACSPTQVDLHGPGPANCPDSAKIGTVLLDTPVLDHPLSGEVYLAEPGENPFGSLLALYIAVDDPQTGVVVKLAGKVEPDPVSGQLKVSFLNNPELPFEDLDVDLFGGPRAVLATPQACGTYTTTGELTPSTTPEGLKAFSSDSFTVNGACAPTFSPEFSAGSTNPQAGAYSPFMLSFSRQDGEQELAALTFTTPPGLLANLASVPACEEPSAPQGGCSQASEIGTAIVAAGAGSHPLYLSGHVYLTGPYRGEPFGLSIAVPAAVGPFNLGIVIIRARITVNPTTLALTITTDQLPQIIDGIALRLRAIDVNIDRPGFFFNPTNCNPLAVNGTIASVQGANAALSSRFQAANCRTLPFAPKLAALTYGNGEFAGHGASLHVEIATAPGQANMRTLKLDLPQRLPARLETIQRACPESAFKHNPATCPKTSVIGSATVATPVLSEAMRGPAILVSHGGAAFPDMVLVLQAQGVRIDLAGALFVDERNTTSTTFRSIPDVPIRRFDLVLPEGPHSALAASASLCTKRPLSMFTAITGQSGGRVKPTVRVAVAGCKHKHRRRLEKKSHAKKKGQR